jgi:uncharacterized GH25 family protein
MHKLLGLFLCVVMIASTAEAHFIWVQVLPPVANTTVPVVQLSFGETPAPGEAHLVNKVQQSKVYPLVAVGAEAKPLELAVVKQDDVASWQGSAPAKDLLGLEASCDYGVLAKGGAPFWLNYYAKHLTTGWEKQTTTSRGKHLTLEVVPTTTAAGLELLVLWNGKPLPNAKVTVDKPDNRSTDLTTNEQGVAVFREGVTSLLAVLVSHSEPTAGERDGKKYESIKHYSTLTIPVALTAKAAEHKVAAPDLLAKAREHRAVWEDFTGLQGSLNYCDNGASVEAKFSINANGEVTLKLADGPARKWLITYLESMVQHRLPTANVKEDVKYVSDNDEHPLGVKLSLGDGEEMDSHYRVRDNVVREVNRRAGKGRFTISVLESKENPEGKYLPTIFTVNTWNAEGALVSSLTEHDSWGRLGKLDVPQRVVQTSAGKDKVVVRLIEFNNLEVPKARTASK